MIDEEADLLEAILRLSKDEAANKSLFLLRRLREHIKDQDEKLDLAAKTIASRNKLVNEQHEKIKERDKHTDRFHETLISKGTKRCTSCGKVFLNKFGTDSIDDPNGGLSA